MVLPASGNPLSLNQLHVEAGGTSETECSLNDADIRQIIGVSADGSQNIQQYYGQSSSFASFDEVLTADNTNTSVTNRYVSFSGGVSDGDVIIVLCYDSGNVPVSATPQIDFGSYVTAPSAHQLLNLGSVYSMWWPHMHAFAIHVQAIVCNSSTANSFYWVPNDSYGKQCQLVMLKYSTGGATNVRFEGTVGGGRNAIGEYSSSLYPNTVISGNQTIATSTMASSYFSSSQSVINIAAKGGDFTSSHDMTFSATGDSSGVITDNGSRPTVNFQNQAHGHNYRFQYYTKQEDKPSSGTYSNITVTPGSYSSGGFTYFHAYMIIS